MAYATAAGMKAIFGTNRINDLADPDETGVTATINANIATAITYADEQVDAKMRNTHFRNPVVTAAGATPTMIASIANRLAGGWLARQWRLESVPPQDAGERVVQYEREALTELDQVARGALRIDAV